MVMLDFPKWAGHVTHFYILGPRPSVEGMKLDISNFVCRLNVKSRTTAWEVRSIIWPIDSCHFQ